MGDEHIRNRFYETLAAALNTIEEDNYDGGFTLPATRAEVLFLIKHHEAVIQLEPAGHKEVAHLEMHRYHYSLKKADFICLGKCIKNLLRKLEDDLDKNNYENLEKILNDYFLIPIDSLIKGVSFHLSYYLKTIVILLAFQKDWESIRLDFYKYMAGAVNAMEENNNHQTQKLPCWYVLVKRGMLPFVLTKSNLH